MYTQKSAQKVGQTEDTDEYENMPESELVNGAEKLSFPTLPVIQPTNAQKQKKSDALGEFRDRGKRPFANGNYNVSNKIYTTAKNDAFWAIAERFYGDTFIAPTLEAHFSNANISVEMVAKGGIKLFLRERYPKITTVQKNKIWQQAYVKEAYAKYITNAKATIQAHAYYQSMGGLQKARINELKLNGDEQRWVNEKESQSASIQFLRYIVMPNDTPDLIYKKTGYLLKSKTYHAGDSIYIPINNKSFNTKFDLWTDIAKHGGALLSDMKLEADHETMPVVWMYAYSYVAPDMPKVAFQFIHQNFDKLRHRAKNNALVIGIGKRETKAISVYTYTHQSPGQNVSIQSTQYATLEQYKKAQTQKETEKEEDNRLKDVQHRKKTTKDFQEEIKAFKTDGSTNLNAFFRMIGKYLDRMLLTEGSKTVFTVDVVIPVLRVLNIGFAIKVEAEKTGGNIKLHTRAGIIIDLVGGKTGSLSIGVKIGQYLDVMGGGKYPGLNAMELYSLVLYQSLRNEASQYLNSRKRKFSLGRFLRRAAQPTVMTITEFMLLKEIGAAMHTMCNKFWGGNNEAFNKAESWANNIMGKMQANKTTYAELGWFINPYYRGQFKAGDADIGFSVESDPMWGVRLDQESLKGYANVKRTEKDYDVPGKYVDTWTVVKPKAAFGNNQLVTLEAAWKIVWVEGIMDTMELSFLPNFNMSDLVGGNIAREKIVINVMALLNSALKKYLVDVKATKAKEAEVKNLVETATTMITTSLRAKMQQDTKKLAKTLPKKAAKKVLGLTTNLQMPIKLVLMKTGETPYLEFFFTESFKQAIDATVFKQQFEHVRPLTNKIKLPLK